MNKKFIIPLVSLGVVVASAATILLANQKHAFTQLNAGDGSYTIELESDSIQSAPSLQADGYYHFQLSGETVRDKKPFVSTNNTYFGCYTGDVEYDYGGDKILKVNDNGEYYGNCFINIEFRVTGPAEISTAKVFYLDGTTEKEEAFTPYEDTYYVYLSVPFGGSITLKKVSFKYYC